MRSASVQVMGFQSGARTRARTGTRHLDAISAGLVYIKKEGLLDRMFVRSGLDIDAILEKDVGGAQNVFARIKREGYVV